eukprot:TRINITY_DN43073_c0_g1_i1.p1 TRINITY_DN43073_c0_g1~~TRINITY_DN43073_c0_g1_i1.p1  ORF type:complete len:391 (-),score=40.17 TRINITY_DN43073_c0_g1_i1:106-1239(-)
MLRFSLSSALSHARIGPLALVTHAAESFKTFPATSRSVRRSGTATVDIETLAHIKITMKRANEAAMELEQLAAKLQPEGEVVDEWEMLAPSSDLHTAAVKSLIKFGHLFEGHCVALMAAKTADPPDDSFEALVKQELFPPSAYAMLDPIKRIKQQHVESERVEPIQILDALTNALFLFKMAKRTIVSCFVPLRKEYPDTLETVSELDRAIEGVVQFFQGIDVIIEDGTKDSLVLLQELSMLSASVEKISELVEWERPANQWPKELAQLTHDIWQDCRNVFLKYAEAQYKSEMGYFVVHTPAFLKYWTLHINQQVALWTQYLHQFRMRGEIDVEDIVYFGEDSEEEAAKEEGRKAYQDEKAAAVAAAQRAQQRLSGKR